MNKRTWTQRGFLALLLIGALLSLTACEMPAQRDDPIQLDPGTQVQVPIDANLQPAAEGDGQTVPVDGYPAPGIDSSGVTTTTTEVEVIVVPEGGEQPAEAAAPESVPGGVYVVQSGDTLGRIAEQYGVTIADIAAANGLVNIDSLDVGQELNIPAAGFAEQQAAETPAESPATEATGEQIHIVARGDNLYRIGLLYGFTVEELTAYNGLLNPHDLDVGQEIKIPPSE